MPVPGSNLLLQALTVIQRQNVSYFQATGRTINSVGQWETTYASSVLIFGSFQPIPRQMYDTLGLDLQKDYYNFYTNTNIIDLERDVSNDQITFKTARFQCESATDWFAMDGWKAVLCCLLSGSI